MARPEGPVELAMFGPGDTFAITAADAGRSIGAVARPTIITRPGLLGFTRRRRLWAALERAGLLRGSGRIVYWLRGPA